MVIFHVLNYQRVILSWKKRRKGWWRCITDDHGLAMLRHFWQLSCVFWKSSFVPAIGDWNYDVQRQDQFSIFNDFAMKFSSVSWRFDFRRCFIFSRGTGVPRFAQFAEASFPTSNGLPAAQWRLWYRSSAWLSGSWYGQIEFSMRLDHSTNV